MPTELKTDEALLERLKVAASKGVNSADIRRQRLSFVFGNMPKDSSMTRHEVEQALNRYEGSVA